jgi:hypothetical protein
MTTKQSAIVNPFRNPNRLELRLWIEPETGLLSMKSNRPAPTVQLLAMVLDAAPMLFKIMMEQQKGIVGQSVPAEPETTPEPEPEKVS